MRSPIEPALSEQENRLEAMHPAILADAPMQFGIFGAPQKEEVFYVLGQGDSSWQKENGAPIPRCDFELGSRIGSGSQGSVHEMMDNQGNASDRVAKKIYFNQDENQAAAEREVFLHKLLTEKANSSYETGIIELLGYQKDRDGVTLEMPRSRLCLAKVVPMLQEMVASSASKNQMQFLLFDLFASLVRGLNTLAKNRVVHCDIKPENIMLSPDGVDDSVDWCLIDFGSASRPDSSGDTGKRLCGTAPYVSPEAAVRLENFYPRDVWAVGYIMNKIMLPSQPETTNMYYCLEERKQALEAAEQQVEDPAFSESDIPSEIHFNSDSERREFFRYIQRSLVGQKCLQLIEAAKNGQTDFNASFVFLINAMLNPIAESRPTACDLVRLLPAFEVLLPAQRSNNYGKKILLEGCELWHAIKEEEEKRKGSEWSLHSSAMFGSSGSQKSSSADTATPNLNAGTLS